MSLRRLRVLINHLPPGSARHRAANGGHEWRNLESLVWQLVYYVRVLDQRLVWTKGKRPKWPKWVQYPWSRNEVTLGDRGEASTEDVLAYLKSLAPPKRGAK